MNWAAIVRLIWIIFKLIDMLKGKEEKEKAVKEVLTTVAKIMKEEKIIA